MARTLSNSAQNMLCSGRLQEANDSLEQTLTLQTAIYGRTHVSTLDVMGCQAVTLVGLGRREEALELAHSLVQLLV